MLQHAADTGTMAEIADLVQRHTGRPFAPNPAVIETDDELIERSRARDRAAGIAWAREFSGMGKRFANRTFAAFRVDAGNRAALEAAKAIVRGERRGLGLVGENGLGKSHLSAAIANEFIRGGEPAVCIPLLRLLTLIKDRYSREREAIEDPQQRALFGVSESAVVRRCANVRYLAIEDIGKATVTPWMLTTLFAIVDARYENELGLVVTSNTGAGELLARYQHAVERLIERGDDLDGNLPEALMDRLAEMTAVPWVTVTGESRRFGASA